MPGDAPLSTLGYMPGAAMAQNTTSTRAHTAPAAKQLFLLTEKPEGSQSSCQHCANSVKVKPL